MPLTQKLRSSLGPTSLRGRFQAWFENRLPLTDQVTLTQRTVYILPTRPGLMLGVTLMVLLVASINYQLNLGYLLTFLLAGCALIGMHVCHGTLRGLAMQLAAPPAAYAGALAACDVCLTNAKSSTRYGIGVRMLHPSNVKSAAPSWAWTDVPPQGSSTVQLAFTPAQRGRHRIPTLMAETRFPLGTFRVWTVWRPALQILVYPQPEPQPPALPSGEYRAGNAAVSARPQSSGELEGVRAYRRGDPMKRVIWRKAAKSDGQSGSSGLVVRDSQQAEQQQLWLDYGSAGAGTVEHKLSRLCAWVLQADRLGVEYGLRLPACELAPASGEQHKRTCLEALALCV